MNFMRSRVLAVSSLPIIFSTVRAAADSYYGEGLYGWYEAGPALVENAKIRDFFGEDVVGNRVKFDTGFHFGLGIGREITDYFRVELESGFNYNSLKTIDAATASSGNIYRVPVMGNMVLQYPNRTRITPVIGAGVGAHWLSLDAQNIELESTVLDDSSSTWVFGYQGYGGLRYDFNERMNVGVFYHYSVADGPSWKFDSIPGGNFKLNSLRTHTLSLTFGWYF
ncbi:MAG: porin family protein [Verrucomicrobia bacterium]|nr:porin family protein [Verrucomicrobiota bacterium]